MKGGEIIMNKKNYIAVAVIAIAAASIMGAASVSAQNTEARTSMIQQLAAKLGIEESKVQTAMDSIHTERQAAMQQQMEDKLTQAVADGKITEAQKQLILKKHAEMKAEHQSDWEAMKNMSPQERREERQSHRAKLEAWADENGIDMSLFFGDMNPKGGMRGYGHMK